MGETSRRTKKNNEWKWGKKHMKANGNEQPKNIVHKLFEMLKEDAAIWWRQTTLVRRTAVINRFTLARSIPTLNL